MLLIKKADELRKWLDAQRKKGNSIGFAPTMGALHAGHISLIEASKFVNHVTVSSIFVNPTQFNDPKDYEKYPITIEKDITMLEEAGTDVLFIPAVKEVYKDGIAKNNHYNLGNLETVLEGKFRPGHFQGVCNVVHRLLEIVEPDNLYLGQKDYQQSMIIKRLIELINRSDKIKINICPTLREANGLAMSSRNLRLKEDERKIAATIFQCLSMIKDYVKKVDLSELKFNATYLLEEAGFKVDYVEIADAGNLEIVKHWDGNQRIVALTAAFLNDVRLIDNMLLN